MEQTGTTIYEELKKEIKNQIRELDTDKLDDGEYLDNTIERIVEAILDRFLNLITQAIEFEQVITGQTVDKSNIDINISKRKNIFAKLE